MQTVQNANHSRYSGRGEASSAFSLIVSINIYRNASLLHLIHVNPSLININQFLFESVHTPMRLRRAQAIS